MVRFLRLWFVLAFSFLLLRILFNLLVLNRIDLRLWWFEEALLIPLGQSLIVWVVSDRGDSARVTPAGDTLRR